MTIHSAHRRRINAFALASLVCLIAALTRCAWAAEAFIEADVPLFVRPDKCFYRLPSLLVTGKGAVLAACQKRLGEHGDFAPSCLVLRRSVDGGKTFEPEQTLFAREGYCTFNGNLVEERQSGAIFACFIAFPQAERTTWFSKQWVPRGGGFSYVKSTDDGKTWSAPVDVLPKPNADGWYGGGAFNNNHGVQIQVGPHAGRLVIGARVFKPGVYEGRAKAGLIYSDDRGETWRVGGVVLKEHGEVAGEVTVGETADHEIYVNSRNSVTKVLARTKQGNKSPQLPAGLVPNQRIYSRSRDGGETFYEEGLHAELYDEPCNAGLTLFTPADDVRASLQLFTAPLGPRRTQLTVHVSRDGGRTWQPGNVISEKAGGYSDVAVLPDRQILTLYEDRGDLLLARYNLGWITAGMGETRQRNK